jgi:hypothetical protein
MAQKKQFNSVKKSEKSNNVHSNPQGTKKKRQKVQSQIVMSENDLAPGRLKRLAEMLERRGYSAEAKELHRMAKTATPNPVVITKYLKLLRLLMKKDWSTQNG